MALYKLKILPGQFLELTPKEFTRAIEMMNKAEKQVYRQPWEVARWLSLHIWNSAGKTLKHRLKEPKEIVEFDWDKETKRPQTQWEMKQILLGISRSLDKKKKTKRP